jgi:hypothetical protein
LKQRRERNETVEEEKEVSYWGLPHTLAKLAICWGGGEGKEEEEGKKRERERLYCFGYM